jgi:threonine-phosphate decarboxylase
VGAEDELVESQGLDIYAISRARGWDLREVLDLSVNVNPLGPPEGVRAAIAAAVECVDLYPERHPQDLAEMVGRRWGVKPELLTFGNGAAELLHTFAWAGWQGPVAVATPTSGEIVRAFPQALRVPAENPERWPQRGLLVLTHPNNLTGEMLPEGILRRAVSMREGPVLVDESYQEFTRLESALDWVDSQPNLLVLRSLSKFYAMPGVRLGVMAASPEWTERLRKKRAPWPIGVLAVAALRAALAADGYADRTRALIARERVWLGEQLREMPGVSPQQATANYLFAGLERNAAEFCEWLLERHKILVRNCTGRPGVEGQAVRIAVRMRADNERFVAAARELVCG